MQEITKKLYYKKANGTIGSIKLYDTAGSDILNTNYILRKIKFNVDGQNVYAFIDYIERKNNKYQTPLKVKKIQRWGEETYSVCSQVPPVRIIVRDWLGTTRNTQIRDIFKKYDTLEEIPLEIDISETTSINGLFKMCKSLTTIPELDTSKVTDMSGMFNDCSNLTSIPQLDTSKVTDMSFMFKQCSNLTTIPKLDTSNVTDMHWMFYECSSLTSVPQMDTSKVTDMSDMFFGCTALTSVPKMDTSKVTNMSWMFAYCQQIKEIPWAIDCSSIPADYESIRNMLFQTQVKKIKLANVSPELKSQLAPNWFGTLAKAAGQEFVTIEYV